MFVRSGRVHVWLAAAVLVLVTVLAHVPAADARQIDGRSGPMMAAQARVAQDTSRAVALYTAMQQYFSTGYNLYRETSPYPPPHPTNAVITYSWLWPYSQALGGTLDVAQLTHSYSSDIQARMDGLRYYWDPSHGAYNASALPPMGIITSSYYDDNAWIGLDLVHVFEQTGNRQALQQAEAIFAFAEGGWPNYAPCGGLSGGIFWRMPSVTAPNYDRTNTATTGNALLGLQLYAITHNGSYLTWSQRMIDWMNANLRDPQTGLYWDAISPGAGGRCVTNKDEPTYDEGPMLSADVLMAQTDPSNAAKYLNDAKALATKVLQQYHSYNGMSASYNAILFRAYFALYPLISDDPTLQSKILSAVTGYADWVWNNARNAQTNVVWLHNEVGVPMLLDQGAVVEIYAGLAQIEQISATPVLEAAYVS